MKNLLDTTALAAEAQDRASTSANAFYVETALGGLFEL